VWLAAVAYGLGPYLLLDALRRGNMPESVALALLPWLLVSFRRLILRGGLGPFVASVLLLVALFLSHNISSLLFAPFLGGYVVLLIVLRFWEGVSVGDLTQPTRIFSFAGVSVGDLTQPTRIFSFAAGLPTEAQQRPHPRISSFAAGLPTEAQQRPRPTLAQPSHGLWAFVAVALAVMVTAWFWMPALLEQDTVQLHLSRTTRNNDFHYNFLTWGEMVGQGPVPHDPDFLNPPMRVYLGMARAVLMGVGIFVVCWPSRWRAKPRLHGHHSPFAVYKGEAVFFALVALGYLWMSTEASVWLWEAVPLLAFVQFPWRLVGRALLPASLLASAAFGERGVGWMRQTLNVKRAVSNWAIGAFFPMVTVALLILLAWPQTYPPKGICAMKPYPALDDVYAFERSGWMGVDPEGSYFPVWVESHPTDMGLAEALVRGETPARLDPQALPEGARVVTARYRPLRALIEVETPAAFQARWLGFYYPGWRVWVDGAPVAVAPEEETGLLTFAVPEGRHEVRVRFGTTPPRAAASAVACLGLVAFVAVCAATLGGARFAPRALSHPRFESGSGVPDRTPSDWGRLLTMAALAVGLLLLKGFVVDRGPTPLKRARLVDGGLPEVEVPLYQPFDGGLTLLGYGIPEADSPSDGEIQVDLLWQARERPPAEYRTSVLLRGQDGQGWTPAGTLRPRGYEPTPPTTMWLPGQYAYDPHIVQPLAGAPPGTYDVVVSLFDKAALTPLSVLGPEGNPLGPDLTLGTVTVTRPQRPPELQALAVLQDGAFNTAPSGSPDPDPAGRCDPLIMWAMTADRDTAAPGEIVGLRWVWEARAAPSEAFSVTLTLARPGSVSGPGSASGPADGVVRSWALPPVAAWWPTSHWQAGDRWMGQPVIRLPGGLTSGLYHLTASIDPLGCEALGRVTLEVVAPERHWEIPQDLVPLLESPGDDIVFGDRIRLIGYAVTTEGATARPDVVRVHLAWQALVEMETSYRVFVHLRRADGQGEGASSVVAQSDGEPVHWTRPTTGWAVGEVVAEVREITLPKDLPSGPYQLYVGLYEVEALRPSAGTRLKTSDGTDAWSLAEVVVP
jgi:hypothetical protein